MKIDPVRPADEDLEAAISRAGRDEVFALAQAAGWSRESAPYPPSYAWWALVALVEAKP